MIAEALGLRRLSGWVPRKAGPGRGLAQGIVHSVDCAEAPNYAPRLGWSAPWRLPSSRASGSAPSALLRPSSTPCSAVSAKASATDHIHQTLWDTISRLVSSAGPDLRQRPALGDGARRG
ncbi:hypothetical protein GCM10009730_66550 [Streptomyces albidochromogenes]